MKTLFFCLWTCVFLAACGDSVTAPAKAEAPPPAATVKPDPKPVRLLVVPFESGMKSKDSDYFSMGLCAFLTERFEEAGHDAKLAEALSTQGYRLEVVSGPLILTPAQAALRGDARAPLDFEAAHAAATAAGATQVLTGAYAGDVGKFRLTVQLYDLDADKGLTLRAEASVGPVSIYAKKAARPGVQIVDVQAMAATLAIQVLDQSGVKLTPDAGARLKTPQTPDAMSFIEYARALERHFRPEDPSKHRTDLEFAAHAVSIWPDFYAARRLYGYLLWQSGSVDKARIHFREILDPTQPVEPGKPRRVGLPDDVRTLTMLGRVELESKQYQAAIGYLERAAAHTPDDAQVHFWLGEAHARLGDTVEAIARYELSRKLNPNDVETHRALSGLYAVSKRYDDAAAELEVVVEKEPQNIQALLLMAACHRAGGHRDKALADYDRGLTTFPEDARLHKFRGDTLSALGRKSEAQEAYDLARKLAPKDARFSGETVMTGDVLVAEIAATDAIKDSMERRRAEASLAASVATWDLAWHGKEACQDGRAGSEFLLAKASAQSFDKSGAVLEANAADIDRALKNGEGFALTPDERGKADELLRYALTSVESLRELRTGYGDARDLIAKNGCALDVRVATIDEVRDRDQHLKVELPAPPARDASGISPVVPSGVVGNVTFKIRNETGRESVIIFLPDRAPLEPAVPAGGEWSYTTRLGYHSFCLLAKDQASTCGQPGTVRYDHFYEGWSAIIR